MARNLAHRLGSITEESTSHISADSGKKGLLNRRECLQVGAVATAAVVGAGGLSAGVLAGSDEDGETYTTDFSEYAIPEGDIA